MPTVGKVFPRITEYSGPDAKQFNGQLMGNPSEHDLQKEQELNLELGLLEQHSNKTVYAHDTRTRIPFETLSKWYLKRIGCIIEFPNFLSTSELDLSYGETKYQIKTSSQSNARYIEHIVIKPTEKEVLFKSHSRFRIQKVDTYFKRIYLDEIDCLSADFVLKEDIFRTDEEIGPEVNTCLGKIQVPDNFHPSLND